MPTKLNKQDIQTRLQKLHANWSKDLDSNSIQRTFSFENYYQTMAFSNSVAWVAHQQNHHPDMLITYNTCLVILSTHSVNGLSELDFKFAGSIDKLVDS